jgi:PBP1b-binding outer membrane lipoprotein LpoB
MKKTTLVLLSTSLLLLSGCSGDKDAKKSSVPGIMVGAVQECSSKAALENYFLFKADNMRI